MSEIRMTPLGGLYEFGNQSYLYQLKKSAILVDAGAFFDDDVADTQIMPDYNYLERFKDNLKGIVITHNHEDHIGGILYVMQKFPNVPVYCTPFIASNIFYRAKRNEIDIPNLHTRLKVLAQGKSARVDDNFAIEFVSVNHSTPEASMVYMKTPAGNILHTGDWRYERKPLHDEMNWARLDQIAREGLLAVVADSTGAENKTEIQLSEKDVADGLNKAMKRHLEKDDIAIVGCFSTHSDRVSSVCDLAKKFGRRVLLKGSSMLFNQEVAHLYNRAPQPVTTKDKIYSSKSVYVVTGTQAEQGSVLWQLANDEYPLDKRACIFMSASVIPSRSREVEAMVQALRDKGYKVVQNDGDNLTHVSGHAPAVDIDLLIKKMKPQIYIPVHGEGHHLQANARIAEGNDVHEIVRFEKLGQSVLLSKQSAPRLINEFQPSKIYVQKPMAKKYALRDIQNYR